MKSKVKEQVKEFRAEIWSDEFAFVSSETFPREIEYALFYEDYDLSCNFDLEEDDIEGKFISLRYPLKLSRERARTNSFRF